MAKIVSSRNKNIVVGYNVFVSFRGEDVRNGFVSHLQAAFKRKGITTFFDEEFKRAQQISPALLEAIQQSSIFVVVFSENYASSRWCLDELLKIVECKNMYGRMVLPVFYNVDPSIVRRQTGIYAEAFAKHEQTLKQDEVVLQRWRDVLTQTANLSGVDSANWRLESEMVDKITQEIFKELDRLTVSNVDGLVGIEDRVERIESCLCASDDDDVRILGIWGMGGIGKTTVAATLFHKIKNKFDGYCFLENVRENSGKNGHGLPDLRKKLLSQVMQEENLGMDVSCKFLIDRLCGRKVLIVLDDIDDTEQLANLAGNRNWFGVGSRIVITTRNKQLLTDQVNEVYDYAKEQLSDAEALVLFSHHVFKTSQPPEVYLKLSRKAISYASGIPLALKLLGSHLCNKDEKMWKSALARLEKFSDSKMFERILKLCFEGLESQEKDILLDVACFFKGENVEFLTSVWDACSFFSHDAISVLSDKCLIYLRNGDSKLWMHDLIQEMCKAFVRKENVEEPGERSRLWEAEDIFHMFNKNSGSSKIECIFLDLSETNRVVELRDEAFVKMEKLRLLKVYSSKLDETSTKIRLPRGLTMLPDSLRYLFWDHYPNKFLPSKFDAQNIVELSFRQSCIEQLKKEDEMFNHSSLCLTNLKRLDLSGCLALSNLSAVFDNMEHLCELSLQGSGLSNLPSSIENLTRLIKFNISYCKKLVSLPDSICNLKLLQELYLDGCDSLQHLPENIGNLESLLYFYANGTSIRCVPFSIMYLKNIRMLSFRWCTKIKTSTSCPTYMGVQLPPLEDVQCSLALFLDGCDLVKVPSVLLSFSSLGYLDLKGNNFVTLPLNIFNNLPHLKELDLSDCTRLRSLPNLPPTLRTLLAVSCTSLESIMSFESLFRGVFRHNAKVLNFGGCLKLMNQDKILELLLQGVILLEKKAQVFYEEGICYDGLRLELRAIYPGSEIPEWFSNQIAKGNTVTLKLPPHCIDNSLGFAFCLIVSPHEDLYYNHDVDVQFRLIFQHNGENRTHGFIGFRGEGRISMSYEEDHVVFGFVAMHDLIVSNIPWPNNCDQIECLVEFVAELYDDPLKVKKCAVSLLNVEGKTGPTFTFNSSSIYSHNRHLLPCFEGGTVCQGNCMHATLPKRDQKRKRHEFEDDEQQRQ